MDSNNEYIRHCWRIRDNFISNLSLVESYFWKGKHETSYHSAYGSDIPLLCSRYVVDDLGRLGGLILGKTSLSLWQASCTSLAPLLYHLCLRHLCRVMLDVITPLNVTVWYKEVCQCDKHM
jgi:hypothetical protein